MKRPKVSHLEGVFARTAILKFPNSKIIRMNTNNQNPKNWWAPVWKGLVFDREGKHYRQMKNAVWLFLYFLLCADRGNGCLKRKIGTIMMDTGFSRDMIVRWLNILRNCGYIDTLKTGRCLSIRVKKWKTPSEVGNSQPQKSEISDRRSWKNPIAYGDPEGRNFSHLSQILGGNDHPNDNTIKKDILKNDNVIYKSSLKRFAHKGFSPGDREDLLALKICKAFQDKENLPLYLAYVKKYPSEVIRRAFEGVNKIPANKIKKTRGALFTYLVKYYAQAQNPH